MKQRILICSLLLLCLLLAACGKTKSQAPLDSQTETEIQETLATEAFTLLMPWEADGAKQPQDYTLEEYEALTPDQRKAFLQYLGAEDYAEWLESAEEEAAQAVEIPWNEPGAKQPKDYTWEEYQKLTPSQQKAFMEALGPQGLELWLKQVRGSQSGSSTQGGNGSNGGNTTQNGSSSQEVITIPGEDINNNVDDFYPWEKSGSKDAADYTWEEYDALSSAQKKAFRDHLGKNFERWLKKVLETEYPWLADGAKQPKDYTWEEYVALNAGQKKEFQKTLGASGFQKWQENALSNMPWKAEGAKQPKDYSWAEYKKLTDSQKGAFLDYLGEDAMMDWLRSIVNLPWEAPNAKQPEQYTLQEYDALKEAQRLAFQLHMGMIDFEAWMEEAKNPAEPNPWEEAGAKQPADYTWEEYNALTAVQQMAFQKHLGNKNFDVWLNKVQSKPVTNPWDVPGAKQPQDYTLKEFNTLTEAQQMAFQTKLGAKGFEAWLNKVQEKPDADPAANPWDKAGAKQPADYTWGEFEALTAAQQMAFQTKLGDKGFEAWLNKVQGKPSADSASNPWDAPGAKQPEDYTWEEFEALTAAQQIAFQNHLGNRGFEAWLNSVQGNPTVTPSANPWDKPGAKQPEDYTWEEFEALTAAQQMAFQEYLGEKGFEAWLNRVLEIPIDEPTEEHMEEPIEESTKEPMEVSADVTEEEPVAESIDELCDECLDEPIDTLMTDPTAASAEESSE